MTTWIRFALAATLSFSAMAQTIELPRVNVPEGLDRGEFAEGTITRLNAAEVAEFLPWAQNSRNTLTRAMNQARSLPLRERLPHIERAVKNVVSRSGSRQYQMLMRFSLNRGLLLVDELERHIDMNLIGSQENALDLLQRSINVSLSFYESDLTFQQRAQTGGNVVVIPHAQFGSAFMQGMYPGVVNVLDATAQYRLLYKLIEMVNWDLSRDAEAPRYAEAIVETFELTQDLPQQPEGSDRANLRLIRRLNALKIINLRSTYTAAQAENTNEADGISAASTPSRGTVGTRGRYASFQYNSTSRYCYMIDNSGQRMGAPSDVVDINLCAAGVRAFQYNSTARYCYQVDQHGNRLGSASDVIDIDRCATGFRSFAYNSTSRYCYKIDDQGNRLGAASDVVDSARCNAGVASFAYNSTSRYCYNVDRDGNRMGGASDVVDTAQCRRGYAMFAYNSTTRYCYATDDRGNRLGSASDVVDNTLCLAQ